MKILLKSLLVLLILNIIVSESHAQISFSKRKYRKGFYVEFSSLFHSKKNVQKSVSELTSNKAVVNSEPQVEIALAQNESSVINNPVEVKSLSNTESVDQLSATTNRSSVPIARKEKLELHRLKSFAKIINPITSVLSAVKYTRPKVTFRKAEDSNNDSYIFGTISLIFGLLGLAALAFSWTSQTLAAFYASYYLIVPLTVAAIIFGIISLTQEKHAKGFAIGGLVSGGVEIIVALVVLMFVALFNSVDKIQ